MVENEIDVTKYGVDDEKDFFSWEIPVALRSDCGYGEYVYTDLEAEEEISEEDVAAGGYLIVEAGWKGVYFAFDPDSQCTVLMFMKACDGDLVEYAREYIFPEKRMAVEDVESGACMVLSSPSESLLALDEPDLLNRDMEEPASFVAMTFGGTCSAESVEDMLSFLKIQCNPVSGTDIPEYDDKKCPAGASEICGQISGDKNGAWFVQYFSYAGKWHPDAAWYFPKETKTVLPFGNALNKCKYIPYFEVGPFSMEEVKGTVLEWYLDAISGFSGLERGPALMNLVYDGHLEQLMKASVLKPLFSSMFSRSGLVRSSDISCMFDFTGGSADGGNVYKSLRVGRKQLGVMMRRFAVYDWNNITDINANYGFFKYPAMLIWEDKRLCDRSKIRTCADIYKKISPVLLDQMYAFITDMVSFTPAQGISPISRYLMFDAMWEFVRLSSVSRLLGAGWFFKKVMEAESSTTESVSIYTDYLNMVRRMGMQNQPLVFQTFKELKEAHDEVTYIYNVTSTEIKSEDRQNFMKVCEDAATYAFADGEFLISVPQKPEDLIKEGTVLHHCVKSYIESVAGGESLILFLRKAGQDDIPFFTIEISSDYNGEWYVRQVHGLCNCNIDTEPEAETFFKKWCREFGIQTEWDYDQCL